jgi:hypothetical protein
LHLSDAISQTRQKIAAQPSFAALGKRRFQRVIEKRLNRQAFATFLPSFRGADPQRPEV